MLPWDAMLRAALSAGVAVDAFWDLSLREWRWLAGRSKAGLGHSELEALMRAFPDGENNEGSDDRI